MKIFPELKEARWWFAWRPVYTYDTGRWVWLKKVYIEEWYRKHYFQEPEFDVTKEVK